MGAELRSQSKEKLILPAHPENPEFTTEQGLTSQEVCQNSSSKFVTCHRYTGNSVKSSSPAHWHKEIEIMHFVEGQGFSHTCQCKGETFDAPAIVIVPSNLIHRTCYAAKCQVNRILFKGESLRLHEADKALESCLNQLRSVEARGSLIIRESDPGFAELTKALALVEELGDADEALTFDPSKAQEDSIKQDKVDAYVAATFANPGTKPAESERPIDKDQLHAEADDHPYTALLRNKQAGKLVELPSSLFSDIVNQSDQEDSVFGAALAKVPSSSMAINAGSIAIALAQNFAPTRSINKSKNSAVTIHKADLVGKNRAFIVDDSRQIGMNLQFKAFLINFLGVMTEYGYFSEFRAGRKPRATRYNDEKIKQLLKYIHDNYNRPMNITELAKMLQVTNQYFCRYFKQLTDMSFIDYLNDLRLQKAAQEIASTQQSIREISTKHGFDTIGYFFKLFRERYNTTPIGYRNSCMETKEIDSPPEAEDLTDTPAYEPHIVSRRRKDVERPANFDDSMEVEAEAR